MSSSTVDAHVLFFMPGSFINWDNDHQNTRTDTYYNLSGNLSSLFSSSTNSGYSLRNTNSFILYTPGNDLNSPVSVYTHQYNMGNLTAGSTYSFVRFDNTLSNETRNKLASLNLGQLDKISNLGTESIENIINCITKLSNGSITIETINLVMQDMGLVKTTLGQDDSIYIGCKENIKNSLTNLSRTLNERVNSYKPKISDAVMRAKETYDIATGIITNMRS